MHSDSPFPLNPRAFFSYAMAMPGIPELVLASRIKGIPLGREAR